MKKCKQCGRVLPEEQFRQYKSRGKGVYNTTQGYHTICKDCESISNSLDYAMKNGHSTALYVEYYTKLKDKGYPPVTAPAKRLLGIEVEKGRGGNTSALKTLEKMLTLVDAEETPVEQHCRLVRERGYESFQAADAVHQQLTEDLKRAGVYEEINNLMDEWYLEE